MSKIDHVRAPASGLNRRKVLVAAAGAAALVGIVPTVSMTAASPSDPSDTLTTARRLATLRWDAFGADSDDYELANEYDEALAELFDQIIAKPIPTPSDVAALAIIARAWQAEDPNRIEEDLGAAEDPDKQAVLQLMASVIAMAEGGVNA